MNFEKTLELEPLALSKAQVSAVSLGLLMLQLPVLAVNQV